MVCITQQATCGSEILANRNAMQWGKVTSDPMNTTAIQKKTHASQHPPGRQVLLCYKWAADLRQSQNLSAGKFGQTYRAWPTWKWNKIMPRQNNSEFKEIATIFKCQKHFSVPYYYVNIKNRYALPKSCQSVTTAGDCNLGIRNASLFQMSLIFSNYLGYSILVFCTFYVLE